MTNTQQEAGWPSRSLWLRFRLYSSITILQYLRSRALQNLIDYSHGTRRVALWRAAGSVPFRDLSAARETLPLFRFPPVIGVGIIRAGRKELVVGGIACQSPFGKKKDAWCLAKQVDAMRNKQSGSLP